MKTFFDLIPDGVTLALTVVLLLIGAAVLAVKFLKRPSSAKMAVVQEWLLWAVARAELALGSGTGEKKLKMVYCWFEVRFPLLCRVIGFEQFRQMVDGALDELTLLLSSPIIQPASPVSDDEEVGHE